jgi:small subunit ribosomal protein S9
MTEEITTYSATGKRKTTVARVWIKLGDGKFLVNNRTLDEYFGGLETAKMVIKQPLEITNTLGKYDVRVSVRGGGTTGTADAIKHGITRALMEVDPGYRIPLKRAGFVTRDSRVKERKKYGQRGARARYQFSKR